MNSIFLLVALVHLPNPIISAPFVPSIDEILRSTEFVPYSSSSSNPQSTKGFQHHQSSNVNHQSPESSQVEFDDSNYGRFESSSLPESAYPSGKLHASMHHYYDKFHHLHASRHQKFEASEAHAASHQGQPDYLRPPPDHHFHSYANYPSHSHSHHHNHGYNYFEVQPGAQHLTMPMMNQIPHMPHGSSGHQMMMNHHGSMMMEPPQGKGFTGNYFQEFGQFNPGWEMF